MGGIPQNTRSQVLIANRHACCVCHQGDVQIHHINGNRTDHRFENLAVLCQRHHDKATAPPGMTARLRPEEVTEYKRAWEEECAKLSHRAARSCTSFYAVDYMNAERLRELYGQLTQEKRSRAYDRLRGELHEEEALRQQSVLSLLDTSGVGPSSAVERLLEEVKTGTVHPAVFAGLPGHPKDTLYPVEPMVNPAAFWYPEWCKIMARTVVLCRGAYVLDELMSLREAVPTHLAGCLVAFTGKAKGTVAGPGRWQQEPMSQTTLVTTQRRLHWKSILHLKTHYVNTMTSAVHLGDGKVSGLLLLRGIEEPERRESGHTVVPFTCTPLIIGTGTVRVP